MHQNLDVRLDTTLTPIRLASVADGSRLQLSNAARQRIVNGHALLCALIACGTRAYGVNTGVGALADTIVAPELAGVLSRNIIMSHAVGVGPALGHAETRAIIAASVAMYAHGRSGVRPVVVDMLVTILNTDCIPVVPRQGSVGYISHRAHIALAMIGHGEVVLDGERMLARTALDRLGLAPLVLEAKEGLSLINGTACATGLAALAIARMATLLDWADVVATMTFEVLGGQRTAIAPEVMALRVSAGGRHVADTMTRMLSASPALDRAEGSHTQDALSLRATPQIHGAARDAWAHGAQVIAAELASATDNPALVGTVEAPVVWSQAHAVTAGVGLAADYLATAAAQLTMLSERRLDRMVNPLVSGLPAFLATDSGVATGFMIAQYTATSLVAENRRLAMPASLDGGRNSGLQEDMLCHATPAALKLLDILANARQVLAIELLAACQAQDLRGGSAPATRAIVDAVRTRVGNYADDRPLAQDMAAIDAFLASAIPADFAV
ncbi:MULTISPECIES: HAL/PAL/TAL family ammonia-lyase [Alphaproteobacteria]|uniref:HAL/PAL/TAL family ammonia-lyase n=1 Tax=Alphaproteobacteria TaxID=28211 RepID=UPI000DB0531F|nr:MULTISPECIES: histidine ammonia-lyase [Alphaproteobacteria]MBY0302719.1 histidine ammonia-lyase [Sphingomonas ginsenosidimutans]PZP65981.1 MAG: histidine ammonia-lyase [Methylorubrum populi]